MKTVETGFLLLCEDRDGTYYRGMYTNSTRYLTLLHDEKRLKGRKYVKARIVVDE